MEVVLIWCLWYAIYRSVADTAANTAHLLVGQPVTTRGRDAHTGGAGAGEPVRARRAWVGRGLGAVFGLARESLLDGWQAGWEWGRHAYQTRDTRRGAWRPWSQPATPDPPRRSDDPRADQPGPHGDAQAPTVDPTGPAGTDSPRKGGDFSTPYPEDARVAPDGTTGSTTPPAGPGRTTASPTGPEEEILDGTPVCWSDLTATEKRHVVGAAHQRWQTDWPDLTVHQCAAAVRDWINATYGVVLTSADVLTAQAGRDDPTWLTGLITSPSDPTAPDSGPGDSPVPALAPAPAVADLTTTPEGATVPVPSGETTNIENTRTYYSALAKHATDDIASQIEISRSYLTAAQMGDQAVMAAISQVEEIARSLAAAAGAVLTALDNHRLMEEAVASTPGAADTDFYRN